MQRRSFLKNSIGALMMLALEHNKIIVNLVQTQIGKKPMDVLLYAIQTKWGDWRIKATKLTNLNKEKLRYKEFDISTFTPLGIFDNSEIKQKQTAYTKEYKAVNSLHSVDHYQCAINGKNYPVSKQATYKSRSKGGKTNLKTGHIQNLGKEWGKIIGKQFGKVNIKFTKTKYAIKAQQNSATYIFEQLNDNNKVVKTWKGKKSFTNSPFNFNSVRNAIYSNKKYKNYYWRIKKSTNKKHRVSKLNKEQIQMFANDCSYKAEFKRKYPQAYYMAKRLGIFEKITKHMKRPKAKNQYTK